MKLYRTRTQAEYDWLARELSKKGMVSYIPRHEQGGDIVVYADEKEDYLSYSDLDYAEKEWPNEPIIEVSDLMSNKFNVGDEVRVREDLISGVDYGSFPFVNSMKEYRGEVVTIHEVNPRATAYEIAEDGGEAYWTDEMLEPITDHDYLMDKILERNNKPIKEKTIGDLIFGDPIEPEHYNKGEIDLFESAYRTRPFSEFRAIMEFIAERYLKRDKDNRIQDLDKAIYTIERLKEYEKLEEEE